jgi:hypothetical protein
MDTVLYFYLFYNLKYHNLGDRFKNDLFRSKKFIGIKKNPKFRETVSLTPINISELAFNAEIFLLKNIYPKILDFNSDFSITSNFYLHSKLNLITFFYCNKTIEELFEKPELFEVFYLDTIVDFINKRKKERQLIILNSMTDKNEKRGISSHRGPTLKLDSFSNYFFDRLQNQFNLLKHDFIHLEVLHRYLEMLFKNSASDINNLQLTKVLIDRNKISIDSFQNELINGFKLDKEMNLITDKIMKDIKIRNENILLNKKYLKKIENEK